VKLKNHSWFAHGKLLITGEYLVLDGAKALAVPLKPGQHLSIYSSGDNNFVWEATSPEGIWFKTILKTPGLNVLETSDPMLSKRLLMLLQKALELSPTFDEEIKQTRVETSLDFNPEYGFGSSSTLIYCLSKWADIDPYVLQQKTFGGSGFDIACADAKGPITFQKFDKTTHVEAVNFSPEISEHIYFVYLGKKQQTSKSIQSFRKKATYTASDKDTITTITNEIVKCQTVEEFDMLLTEHEKLISQILKTPTIKSTCFSTSDECVKSLGAWGGDFVLITSRLPKQVFTEKMEKLGYPVTYTYSDLVLG
jgi:mevalonate kinase